MTEQAGIESSLGKTLRVLVQQVGLTPEELAQFRLSHLHLVGQNPNITFIPEGSDKSKTVELDLEAHRALVGWLVARPDSKNDFLFPGKGEAALDVQEIQRLIDMDVNAAEASRDKTPGVEPEETGAEKKSTASSDETIMSGAGSTPPPSRPILPPAAPSRPMPPSSRPEPPPSRPEMGAPRPEMDSSRIASSRPVPPPPTAPELDESVSIPLPTAAPGPPAQPRPSEAGVGRGPDKAQDKPAVAPKETKGDTPPSEAKPAVGTPIPPGQQAVQTPIAAPPETDRQAKAKDEAQPRPLPVPSVTAEEAAAKAKRAEGESTLSRWLIWASVGVLVVLCGVCLGGGYLISQTGPGSQLLASLGLLSVDTGTDEELAEAVEDLPATAITESPLATPTLPPTATPSPSSTATVLPPTDTPTLIIPTDTPEVAATETPVVTNTPVPADTPTPAGPVESPTPTDTPTPAVKYGAPVLIEPEDEFAFIEGNTLVLRWQPVGELAPDEQYAVRMVYTYKAELTYQGANVKETEWLVPLSLYGQIDGPDDVYEWFVVVERLNDDGSGTAISPESERRTFTWR